LLDLPVTARIPLRAMLIDDGTVHHRHLLHELVELAKALCMSSGMGVGTLAAHLTDDGLPDIVELPGWSTPRYSIGFLIILGRPKIALVGRAVCR